MHVFVGEPANPGNGVIGKHVALCYVLECRRLIPCNLAAFMGYAASIILPRKVGGEYIFPHHDLLGYFAALVLDNLESAV